MVSFSIHSTGLFDSDGGIAIRCQAVHNFSCVGEKQAAQLEGMEADWWNHRDEGEERIVTSRSPCHELMIGCMWHITNRLDIWPSLLYTILRVVQVEGLLQLKNSKCLPNYLLCQPKFDQHLF